MTLVAPDPRGAHAGDDAPTTEALVTEPLVTESLVTESLVSESLVTGHATGSSVSIREFSREHP